MEKIRYCKKCGSELLSTNKGNKCDACKRKKASCVRKIWRTLMVFTIAGIAVNNKTDNKAEDKLEETKNNKYNGATDNQTENSLPSEANEI